jgi:tetratricopeptide (TPR) repeat protein
MDLLKHVIREAHRRSLWQVLSVYLVGSWGSLQVVEGVTENAGLPDWVPPFSLILLIIGLPVVLATAIVQEGLTGGENDGGASAAPSPQRRDTAAKVEVESRREATTPNRVSPESPGAGSGAPQGSPAGPGHAQTARHRLFTWRNAVAGGIGAFALLGVAVVGYFVMWSTGIGPVGSLAAQGLISDGDRVVLADFDNATPDSLLSSVVTEALRIDLATSEAITLVEPDAVRQVLARMQRDPNQPLSGALAREVAVRDGMKAVLEGDVGAAGTGYILSATLRAAESGETLASFRRTAESAEGVIQAIDKLSQDIREKTGESLRTIKRGAPLEEVTTTSLEALRKFTEAEERFSAGDEAGSLALLEEAIALDSTFAMAHRKIAITLRNLGIEREREIEALTAAYRYRDRLTERERLITEATYHNGITGDRDAIIRAYEGVLRIAPDDAAALNNLANVYTDMEDFDRAEELYERAVNGPGTSNTAHSNLVRARLLQGDLEGARAALAAFEAAHPEDPGVQEGGFWVHAWAGEWSEAEAVIAGWEANPELPFVYRVNAHEHRAQVATARGRIGEARREIDQARELAEAEFGPGEGWFYALYAAYLERVTGNTARARELVDAVEDGGLFEEIPVAARDYGLAVVFHNMVGNAQEARSYLRRWAEEVPEALRGRYDEAARALQEGMVGGAAASPEKTLAAIESYRTRLRCRRCYRVQEAEALAAAGRFQEARDVNLSLATEMEGNFTVSLLQRAQAWERAGLLSDEVGDTVTALDAYRHFVEQWSDADPELQPRVQVARERIAALDGSTP